MSDKTSSLTDAMKAGMQNRPTGRLQSMFGKEAPKPIAVPMERDSYEIELIHVKPNPHQPRQTFDEEELANLAASIRTHGVLQPVIVKQDDEDYVIVAGERRWRAAKLAGLHSVPCIVAEPDADSSVLSLIENIQRADLEPLEAAQAIQAFMDEHKLSQRDAADRLGKPKTWIAELLGILSIPSALLERSKRLPKHALIQVSRVKNHHAQAQLLERLLSSPAPVQEARASRGKGQLKETVHHYREVFQFENDEPIEIRWRKHPDEVTPLQLAERLGAVVRELVSRGDRK